MAEMRLLLASSDPTARVHFYGELLGLAIERSWDEPGNRGWIFVAGAEARIEVLCNPHYELGVPGGAALVLNVGDVIATCDRLAAAGVAIIDPPTDQPWGSRNAKVTDPEGFVVILNQPLG
jgi:lactoylglutathione lyase